MRLQTAKQHIDMVFIAIDKFFLAFVFGSVNSLWIQARFVPRDGKVYPTSTRMQVSLSYK